MVFVRPLLCGRSQKGLEIGGINSLADKWLGGRVTRAFAGAPSGATSSDLKRRGVNIEPVDIQFWPIDVNAVIINIIKERGVMHTHLE